MWGLLTGVPTFDTSRVFLRPLRDASRATVILPRWTVARLRDLGLPRTKYPRLSAQWSGMLSGKPGGDLHVHRGSAKGVVVVQEHRCEASASPGAHFGGVWLVQVHAPQPGEGGGAT